MIGYLAGIGLRRGSDTPAAVRGARAAGSEAHADCSQENPNPVVRVAADGTILYANPASEGLLSMWKTQIGARVPEEWFRNIAEALDEGRPREVEVRCDGRVLALNVVPVTRSGWVNLYGTDITERRRAEEDLRRLAEKLEDRVWERTFRLKEQIAEREHAEEYLRLVMNSVADGLLTIDENGIVESFNPSAEEVFGYTAAEIVGRNVGLLMPEEEGKRHGGHVDAYLRSGRAKAIGMRRTVMGRRKDGTFVPLDIAVGEIRIGDRRRFVGSVRDVSERMRAEEAVRRVQQRLIDAIESLPASFALFDAEDRLVICNEKTRELLGWRRELTEPGTPYEDILRDLAEREVFDRAGLDRNRWVAHYLARHREICEPVEVRRRDGRWIYAVERRTSDGGTVAIRLDITERKRAEEAAARYARELERSNADLEEFAYIASHDLQEPLRKVQAFGDRLQAKYGAELGEQGRDYVARMQNATRRMQTLISDLLRYSRVTSKAQPFEPVDLGDVVRGVIGDLEVRIAETGARIVRGDLPTVEADPLQMRQLMQNLIGNALKYCREGVPPVVEIGGELVSSSDAFRIVVRDNGIGFEEKYAERIFGIFQRLHGRGRYEGTGIGLALCRKIVERHGGAISASGRPGEGATFTVLLPLRQPNANAPQEA